MNAVSRAELDAVRGSGATLVVIEPGPEFVVLTKHGTAMMDGNLIPEPTASDRLRRTARRNRFAAFGIWISRYYLCQNACVVDAIAANTVKREQCDSLPRACQKPPNGASSYFV